ncbi:Phosphate transporter PHO1 homolog 1 [Linum grandiflorum]
MVKFSKQFEGQLVPEWKEAFVDYCKLKKDLKKFPNHHTTTTTTTATSPINNGRSYFANKLAATLKKLSHFGNRSNHGAIQVHKKLASSLSKGDMYETELLDQFEDSDAAKDFFACLDLQLNKVNQFFKTKEKEFVERGDCLKKQMDILIELKAALKETNNKGSSTVDQENDPSFSCTISCEDSVEKEPGEEEEEENTSDESGRATDESGELGGKSMRVKREDIKMRTLSGRVFSYQGKSLRLNIPLTTPLRTFSAISYLVWGDSAVNNQSSSKKCNPEGSNNRLPLHINKTKLHHAEKMIRGAFIELYKGLGYLKTYRNLNLLAFIKILKKFDKVTGKQVLPIYLKVVESSYFNSSDKVVNLADEVEQLFIKHFAEDDRRKAMKYLKPQQRKESHSVTFFIGLFTGCFIALLAGYVIMAHVTGMYKPQPSQTNTTVYMETAYPVLSMFSLIFLHFFMYGCNIFMWRKARINHSFIFELAPTKDLKYRDVFLICTTSMTVVLGIMFAHLSLMSKGYSYSHIQAIPGLLLLAFLLLLVCPFNIFYQSSRYRFLSVIRNIILSPLYKVVMLDFFMADQLCSQVPMLRNLEYVACYYITGSYKTQDYNYCMRAGHYRDLSYAVSFLPYYWRAMQCARRWFDEGETSHLVNLGKYVSAMLAAGAKVAYEKDSSLGWLCVVVAVSSAATIYQLYWDFVKDWGLLQMDSKNPWLRDELMLRQKFIYYFSMGLNLVLRLAWLQTVLHSSFEHVDYRVTGLFLAALEVIRRGHWNFYRLENEHLNNAGKFRAVKTVPLPFHEVDEED